MAKETQMKTLIKKLQDNKLSPAEEMQLYKAVEEKYRPHKTSGNYLYNEIELKEEFIMATWNALYRADLDLGDPLMFAVRRGNGAMLDYYRKVSAEKLLFVCQDCGHTMSHDHRTKSCKLCKSTNLKSIEKYTSDEYITENLAYEPNFIEEITADEMSKKLIKIIKGSSLSQYEKTLLINAIKYREDVYEYVKSVKTPSYAMVFLKKIRKVFCDLDTSVLL